MQPHTLPYRPICHRPLSAGTYVADNTTPFGNAFHPVAALTQKRLRPAAGKTGSGDRNPPLQQTACSADSGDTVTNQSPGDYMFHSNRSITTGAAARLYVTAFHRTAWSGYCCCSCLRCGTPKPGAAAAQGYVLQQAGQSDVLNNMNHRGR